MHARHVVLKIAARPRDRLPEACRAGPPPPPPPPPPAIGRPRCHDAREPDPVAWGSALVVEVEGATVRWDGGVYHLCWSLDPALGRRPVEAQFPRGRGRIAWLGWTPVEPVEVTLLPARS